MEKRDKTGKKKSGVCALVFVLVLASESLIWAKEVEDIKIYTVFASGGVQHFESQLLKPLTNEDILRKLRSECNRVDFVVGSFPHKIADVKRNYNGVLIFGGLRSYSIALTGLPTIVVYNFPEFLHIPYGFFLSKGKILIACIDRANTCSASVSSSMFEDLVEKIKLIQVLRR